jgi:tetratricopeptide (TPR) repeat protein
MHRDSIRVAAVSLLPLLLLALAGPGSLALAAGGKAQLSLTVADSEGLELARVSVQLFHPGDAVPVHEATTAKGGLCELEVEAGEEEGQGWEIGVGDEDLFPVRIEGQILSPEGEVLTEIPPTLLRSARTAPLPVPDGSRAVLTLTVADDRALAMQSWREGRRRAAAAAQAQRAEASTPQAEALRQLNAGDLEGALAAADAALAQDPSDIEMLTLRARVLFQAGRFDEAQQAASAALEVSPENPQMLEMPLRIYAEYANRGDWEKARQALMLLIETNPADRRGPEQLKQLAQKVTKEKGLESVALSTWQAYAEIETEDYDAWQALTLLHAGRGDRPAATRALERAAALRPASAAQLYTAMGDRVEETDLGWAVELFETAIERDRRFSPAYKKLGYSLWRQGTARNDPALLSQALERLREYQRLEPQKADREGVVEAIEELQGAVGSGS